MRIFLSVAMLGEILSLSIHEIMPGVTPDSLASLRMDRLHLLRRICSFWPRSVFIWVFLDLPRGRLYVLGSMTVRSLWAMSAQ